MTRKRRDATALFDDKDEKGCNSSVDFSAFASVAVGAVASDAANAVSTILALYSSSYFERYGC